MSDPVSKAEATIVKDAKVAWARLKALWAWIYREAGLVLSVFKVPDKSKYSAKRVIALGLAVDAIFFTGFSSEVYAIIIVSAKLAVAAGLMVLAEVTKT
jgi:hypothetical protein